MTLHAAGCSQDSTFEHSACRLHRTPVAAARQAMASLPPEPTEGCTPRVARTAKPSARASRASSMARHRNSPAVVATEGADCFQDWRLYRVDVHPEVVVEETFTQAQSAGLAAGALSAVAAARLGHGTDRPVPGW